MFVGDECEEAIEIGSLKVGGGVDGVEDGGQLWLNEVGPYFAVSMFFIQFLRCEFVEQ